MQQTVAIVRDVMSEAAWCHYVIVDLEVVVVTTDIYTCDYVAVYFEIEC